MKQDKFSQIKPGRSYTIDDLAPRLTKTQPRILKYKNNRLVNPEQYSITQQLSGMQDVKKLNRSPVRLEKLIKPSKFQKGESIKSPHINSTNHIQNQQKQPIRIVEDDTLSRLSRASRSSKYEKNIKLQNQEGQAEKNKQLSKQLAMKIRNESICNFNLSKNRFIHKNLTQKSVVPDFHQIRSNYSTRSQRIKTEAEQQYNKLQQLKEEENQIFQDQEIWSNQNIKSFLEYHGIKDKYELFEFLEKNQYYSPSLYNTGHISNLGNSLKPSETQYKSKFQGEDEGQSLPLLKQQDYETLHKLAMIRQSWRNFTTTEAEFNLKAFENNQIYKPDNQITMPKKQISYTTSYGFNYPSRLDYESKIIQKPRQDHVMAGCPLLGNTQYKNTFVDLPTQSFTATELAQFFKEKQNDSNPMKISKGVNFFNSTYKQQFYSKSINKNERLRAKSQLECSIQHPKDSIPSMYLTSTHNDYTKYEPTRKRKQRVNPEKYGALSRLKTILMLNKSLKKELTPHVSRDQTTIVK